MYDDEGVCIGCGEETEVNDDGFCIGCSSADLEEAIKYSDEYQAEYTDFFLSGE